MKIVRDPRVLADLIRRLRQLSPESPRRWGTLTAAEMLCHLGDATDMVLQRRPATPPSPDVPRPVARWLGLWTAIPWPKGRSTRPYLDPRAEGTRPGSFDADRERAIGGLEAIAAAGTDKLIPAHGVFGTMSLADWQRWAYRHTQHHLRQFGV